MCNLFNMQPLHCGFVSDKGGNEITVRWYKRKQNLHHVCQIHCFIYYRMYIWYRFFYSFLNCIYMKVWDVSIIETEVERFYDSELSEFVDAIQQNITVHDMSLICKNQYEKLCFKVYYVNFFFFFFLLKWRIWGSNMDPCI